MVQIHPAQLGGMTRESRASGPEFFAFLGQFWAKRLHEEGPQPTALALRQTAGALR